MWLDIETNGRKLSTEVIGTHGLQKEYEKHVYLLATSYQVGNNSFNSVLAKVNGVYEKQVKLRAERQPFYDISF